MTEIEFLVEGNPKGQPRPRAFAFAGRVRVYDPGTAEGWKSAIAEAARPFLPEKPIAEPVSVRCNFLIKRPKAHYRQGQHAGELRADAPYWCVSKPDLDNYEKAVWDALVIVGILKDDSFIVRSRSEKLYTSATPGAMVRISPTAVQ